MPDIEALVAKAREGYIRWHNDAVLIKNLADALERQQAVVEAARERVENCHQCDNGLVGVDTTIDATGLHVLTKQICPCCGDLWAPVTALDTLPEGEG